MGLASWCRPRNRWPAGEVELVGVKRQLLPLFIMALCAVVARWGWRQESSLLQPQSSALAEFTTVPWRKVCLTANISRPEIVIVDPDRIARLVRMLAEPPGKWEEGGMNSDLGFSDIVFEGPDSEVTNFLVSNSAVYFARPGSPQMRRWISREQRNLLARFFRTPKVAGPTMLDVDSLNDLLESARPLSLTHGPAPHPRYRQIRGVAFPPVWARDVAIDAVWRNGVWVARVRQVGGSPVSHLGLRSGDLILSVDGVSVWDASRLECGQFVTPEASTIRFELERAHQIMNLEVPIETVVGIERSCR
jgi:hypothetical protein